MSHSIPSHGGRMSALVIASAFLHRQPAAGRDGRRDGAFVRLAGVPAMPSPSVCDLSRDGRKILFNSSVETASTQPKMRRLNLPTRQPDWLDLRPFVPRDTMAALSPDASKVAVLSSADERARVDVIDVASRTGVRLWTADEVCWSSWESGISWSPDGRLIAATLQWFDHEDTYDDQDAVVVLSTADGSVQYRYDFHGQLGGSMTGSWTVRLFRWLRLPKHATSRHVAASTAITRGTQIDLYGHLTIFTISVGDSIWMQSASVKATPAVCTSLLPLASVYRNTRRADMWLPAPQLLVEPKSTCTATS